MHSLLKLQISKLWSNNKTFSYVKRSKLVEVEVIDEVEVEIEVVNECKRILIANL